MSPPDGLAPELRIPAKSLLDDGTGQRDAGGGDDG